MSVSRPRRPTLDYCPCRLFAASLQLVNSGNIDFDCASGGDAPQLLVNCLVMQDRQRDYRPPSHASRANKVLSLDAALCRAQESDCNVQELMLRP